MNAFLALEKYTQEDYDVLFRLFMTDANANLYFNEKKGMNKLVELLETDLKPWDILQTFTAKSFVYKETFIK